MGQTRVVLLVSPPRGFLPIEFCSWLLPVLPVGESPAIWSAIVEALTARARSSLTWGSAAPEIPPYPPSTPDPGHQIAPTWYPCTPGPCPRQTVLERLRTGPDTAVHPAPMGCCGPRHGGSPQCLEGSPSSPACCPVNPVSQPRARRTSARFCDAGGEPRRWGCWMGMGGGVGRSRDGPGGGVWGDVPWGCSSRGE